jgi:hypothetical protein
MLKSDLHGLHGLAGGCQLRAGDIPTELPLKVQYNWFVYLLYGKDAEEGKFGLLAAIFTPFLGNISQTTSQTFGLFRHTSSLRTPQSNHAAALRGQPQLRTFGKNAAVEADAVVEN